MTVVLAPPVPNEDNQVMSQAFAYLANYQAAGVDAPAAEVAFLGEIGEAIVERGGPTWGEVDPGEAFPTPSQDFLEAHPWEFDLVLKEVPVEITALVHGGTAIIAANAITTVSNMAEETVGPTDKQVAIGVYDTAATAGIVRPCPTYYQFFLRHGVEPNCNGLLGFSQMWKGLVIPNGDRTWVRKGIVTWPITVKARWDKSVTPVVTSGAGVLNVAIGPLGRKFTALA